jgi:hypothetical protein
MPAGYVPAMPDFGTWHTDRRSERATVCTRCAKLNEINNMRLLTKICIRVMRTAKVTHTMPQWRRTKMKLKIASG